MQIYFQNRQRRVDRTPKFRRQCILWWLTGDCTTFRRRTEVDCRRISIWHHWNNCVWWWLPSPSSPLRCRGVDFRRERSAFKENYRHKMHQKRTLRCSTNLVAARMGKKYKMFRLLMARLMRFVAVRRLECRHMLIPSSHLCRQTLFSGYCVLARHMQIMTDKNNDREKSENDTMLRAVCRHFLWLSVAGEPLQTIITFIEKTNANAACCKRVLHTAEWWLPIIASGNCVHVQVRKILKDPFHGKGH